MLGVRRLAPELCKCSSQLIQNRGIEHKVAVVLKQDIEEIGRVNDIALLSAGYVRNHLYPSKKVVYAPKGAEPTVTKKPKKVKAVARAYDENGINPNSMVRQRLPGVMRALTSKKMNVSRAVQPDGTLKSPMSVIDVCAYILRNKRVDLPPELLNMKTAIRNTGEHRIPLKLALKRGDTPHIVLEVKASEPKKTASGV